MPKFNFNFGTAGKVGAKPSFGYTFQTPKAIVSTDTSSMDVGARFTPTKPPLVTPKFTVDYSKLTASGKGSWNIELKTPFTDALNAGLAEGLGHIKTSIAGVVKMVAQSTPTIKGGYQLPQSPELSMKMDETIDKTESWIKQYEPESLTTFQALAKDLTSGAVSIFSSIGIGVLTGGAGSSAALFGLMQAGDKYVEQVKNRVPTKQAAGISTAQGFVEASLEFIGLDSFLKIRNGTVWNTLIRAGTEAVQEASQTFGENLLDTVWDKDQKLQEGVGRSALIGGLLGLPAAVSVSSYEQSSEYGQAVKRVAELGPEYAKRAEAIVQGIVQSVNEKVVPLVDETLQEARKSITLPDFQSVLGIQKTNPLKTTSGIGALVGTPQTVEGGVKPAPRFHLALSETATVQPTPISSPIAAISTQETSIPPSASEDSAWKTKEYNGLPAEKYIQTAKTETLKRYAETSFAKMLPTGFIDAVKAELAKRAQGESPLVVARREGSLEPVSAGNGKFYIFRQTTPAELKTIRSGGESGTYWTTEPQYYLPKEGEITLVSTNDLRGNVQELGDTNHFQERSTRTDTDIVDVIDRYGVSVSTPPIETPPQIAPPTKEPTAQSIGTLYHGSPRKGLTELHPSSAQGFGYGVYFATSRDLAAGDYVGDGGGEVYSATLSPDAKIADMTHGFPEEQIATTKAYEKYRSTWGDNVHDALQEEQELPAEAMRELGYDAVILPDGDQTEVVVFNPAVIQGLKPTIAPPEIVQPPVAESAPTVSKMEIPPSTEKGAVVQPAKPTKVVWSDWIQGVGERWTSDVGSGRSEKIELPVVYRIAKGKETIRQYNPSETAEQGTAGPWMMREATRVELKGDKNTYYLVEWSNTRGWRNASLIEAKSGMSAATAYSKTVKGARLSVLGKASEAIKNMKKTMGKTSYEEMLSKATQDHGEVANPMPITQPSITNTAPLPAGQTTSGEEVTPSYASNEPNLSTSGTSQTIPADNDTINRITVAFDQIEEHLGEKKSDVKAVEGTFQSAFAKFLKESGIPKGALSWEQALDWYKASRGEKSFAKRVEMVKRAVAKYNLGIEQKQRTSIITEISSLQAKSKSGVYALAQEELDSLLGKYRKSKLSKKHKASLEASRAYFAEHPDQDLPANLADEISLLDKETLKGMSVKELTDLREKVKGILSSGKEAYREWKKRNELKQTLYKKSVLARAKSLGGATSENIGTVMTRWQKLYQDALAIDETLEPTDVWMNQLGLMNEKRRFDDKYNHFLFVTRHIKSVVADLMAKNRLTMEDRQKIKLFQIVRMGREDLIAPIAEHLKMTVEQASNITLTEGQKEVLSYMDSQYKAYFPIVQDYLARVKNQTIHQEDFYAPLLADPNALGNDTIESNAVTFYHNTKTISADSVRAREQLHYLTTSDAVSDFERYVTDMQYMIEMGELTKRLSEVVVSKEFQAKAGVLGQSILSDWLDTMARRGGASDQQRNRLLDLLRKNTNTGYMTAKLGTVFVQFTAIADGFNEIGIKWMVAGAERQVSPEWRSLMKDFAAEVYGNEADPDFTEPTWWKGLVKGLRTPVVAADAVVRRTVFLGAYARACERLGLAGTVEEFSSSDKEVKQTIREALAEAMQVTRKAQGTSEFKDQPLSISRGRIGDLMKNRSVGKLITQFQSFNFFRFSNIKDTIWTSGIKKGRLDKALGGIFWLLLVASMSEVLLRRGARWISSGGKTSGEATDKITMSLKGQIEDVFGADPSWLTQLTAETFSGLVDNIPFMGQLVGMMMYGKDPLPVADAIIKFSQGMGSIVNGASGTTKLRGVAGVVSAGGALMGVPGSAQVGGTLRDVIVAKKKPKFKFTLPY